LSNLILKQNISKEYTIENMKLFLNSSNNEKVAHVTNGLWDKWYDYNADNYYMQDERFQYQASKLALQNYVEHYLSAYNKNGPFSTYSKDSCDGAELEDLTSFWVIKIINALNIQGKTRTIKFITSVEQSIMDLL